MALLYSTALPNQEKYMFIPKLKRIALAAAIQTAIAVPAFSQNGQIEEIVVLAPIRDSQAAAIETKRNANNTMDVISADTIGRFPDQNLADSLGRMPGLAIERDQGQARFINLRGAPFRYTTIAFDGINVPGAEGGRVPRFDSFPSVITSRLEANKAILPSMPGEAVAGFINIRTFSPFDQEGFSFATDIGTGKQSLGDGDVSKYSLRGSWSGEQFGVMAFASENSREQVTDNREYDLDSGPGSELTVNELDYRSYFVERSDSAWGANMEYRGNGGLQALYLKTLYSEFVDEEERNQFVFAVTNPAPGVVRNGVGLSVSRLLEDGEYKNSTFTNTLGANFISGVWNFQAQYNNTETELLLDLPIPRSVAGSATGRLDLSDIEDPILSLDQNLADIAYPVTIGIYYVQNFDVDNDKFKFDASRNIEWFDHSAVLELGAQFDRRDGQGFIATPGVGGFPSTVDIASFNTGSPWESKTTNSLGATYYDNVGLRQAWEQSGTLVFPTIGPENMIALEENIDAYYAMVTTDFIWGNLVLGARYEQTDYTSSGNSLEGPISVSEDFSHFLPSAHLNFNLADNLKLRLSATTGLSRPTYNEWRATARVDVTNQRISGGNPRLEAEKARGFDASLEWYYSPASIVSVGAFQRSIDNVIYADSTPVDAGIYLPSAAGETWTYTGSVNGDDGKMQGIEFNMAGSATEMWPSPFDGFGWSGNVTFLDSEFKGIDGMTYDLPGTSDMIYNASVFYEKYDFSIRLNYQYRDEWISPIEDPSEYWGEQQRIDMTAIYTLPMDLNGATMSVYLNGNNLTDEVDNRYAGNGTINQRESYGRYWLVGFRVNF
jgi:TonB-dependent receptor